MLSALDTMKVLLRRNQRKQAQCCTESGIIKNEFKYIYSELVEEAKYLKQCIDFMESL